MAKRGEKILVITDVGTPCEVPIFVVFYIWATSLLGFFRVICNVLVLRHKLLPILSVEFFCLDLPHRCVVQTVNSYTVSVGIRARNVEGLHPTGGAENVLRLVRVEGVGLQAVVTLEQFELTQGNNEVLVLFLDADAAVAVYDVQNWSRVDFEANGTAVTPARVFNLVGFHSPQTHFSKQITEVTQSKSPKTSLRLR